MHHITASGQLYEESALSYRCGPWQTTNQYLAARQSTENVSASENPRLGRCRVPITVRAAVSPTLSVLLPVQTYTYTYPLATMSGESPSTFGRYLMQCRRARTRITGFSHDRTTDGYLSTQ
jgi:hypothetical protein